MMGAVGFNPRTSFQRISRVAERRLNHDVSVHGVVNRRSTSDPWIETNEYDQKSLRDGDPLAK